MRTTTISRMDKSGLQSRPSRLTTGLVAALALSINLVGACADTDSKADDKTNAGGDLAVFGEDGFDRVLLTAQINGEALIFTVANNENREVLVADEFCFDMHLRSTLLVTPSLTKWRGSFNNGITHGSRTMRRIAAGGSYKCALAYSQAELAQQPTNGILVWHTALFVGSMDGRYTSRAYSGAVPVILPIGTSLSVPRDVDSLSLFQFRHRSTLGVIPP